MTFSVVDRQNLVRLLCAVNITGDIKNFVQILILLNEAIIVEISGNNEKHKKADRILEMPRLGVCVGLKYLIFLNY